MGQPGKKDELRRTGVALVIVACGLVAMTGCMAVLMLDDFREHKGDLNGMLAIGAAVLLAGIGCFVVAGVRDARRTREASRTMPRDPDPD